MRYFIEVSLDEALAAEEGGTAQIMIGASGGSSFGSIVRTDEPWLMLLSRKAREERLYGGRADVPDP